MIQVSPYTPIAFPGQGACPPPPDCCFEDIRRNAERCPCHSYRQYFEDNSRAIRDRCRGRNPYDFRTDDQDRRWEKGRIAETQIREQSDTRATIQAGEYELTFDKTDQSMRIKSPDGSCKTVNWKFLEDPHVQRNGKEIGTIKNNIEIDLDNGTNLRVLMGNGKGGKPGPGEPTFVDTVALRASDGTGALVTGVSGPGKLGVTPLDSSHSAEFLTGQALNRLGGYEASATARSPELIGVLMWQVLMRLLFISVGFFVVFGLIDYGVQRFIFIRDHRMNDDEIKREHKEQNGNPEVKQVRKELANELLMGDGGNAVASANLVVANPTHYAVAIAYRRGSVPRVVAKGLDAEALQLRAAAEHHQVPVIVNPPLARTLFRVPVGGGIPRDCFQLVGLMLHWVDQLQTRTRDAGGGFR